MKILMDSDCLIKITKSGLKKIVCKNFNVTIPSRVKEEVVNAGIKYDYEDAYIIDSNIRNGLIEVERQKSKFKKGEQQILNIFQSKKYDAVATDDSRFIKILKLANINYIIPSVFIVLLFNKGIINFEEACKKLDDLAAFISDDEYMAARIFLKGEK